MGSRAVVAALAMALGIPGAFLVSAAAEEASFEAVAPISHVESVERADPHAIAIRLV